MVNKRIELIFNETSLATIQKMIFDYFSLDNSLEYPIVIIFEAKTRKSKNPDRIDLEFTNFRVVQHFSDDQKKPYKELACVRFRSYSPRLVVFFEAEDIDELDWKKVEDLVRKFIDKTKTFDLEIESVSPPELCEPIQVDFTRPWESIKDRGNDREILKLWCENKTNQEISEIFGNVEKKTITNIISRLRQQYGDTIVPTQNQRRISLNKKRNMILRDKNRDIAG